MKKFLALILAILMIGSVLAACGGSGDSGKSGDSGNSGSNDGGDPFNGEDNITLLVWAADKAIDVTKELCDEFKAQYPDKKIEITVNVQGENDAAAQVLNDKDAAADVFSFACDQLTRLLNANALAPVFDVEKISARNTPASVDAATLDGTLYAFPETGDNGYYLVYDKDIITDDDAKTLEGVLEACKKANRKLLIDAGNGFFSCMFPFTGGLTLEGIDEEGTQLFNDYDEEKVVDTLEAFAKLFHEYKDYFMAAETTKVSTGIAGNNKVVGAGIDGSWNAAAVAEVLGDNFGAAKLPTINVNGTDEQIISMHGYKLIGVNKRTKFPNASQLLADFLTDEKAQLARAEKLSWGPSNVNAVSNDIVTGNVALSAIIEQSAYSVPQVNIVDTFWTPMGTLGDTLWKQDDYSRDTIKANFEKTISNIKDE